MRYTKIPPSTTQLIANGDTITVFQIVVNSNGGIQTANIFEGDGTTLIQSVNVGLGTGFSNPTVEIGTEFIAKRGISITTGSNCDVTIFYTQGGA